MTRDELIALAAEVEGAADLPTDLAARAIAGLNETLPAAGAAPVNTATLESTDAVLLMVDRALPGWSIKLDGTASEAHGHWTCSLRQSGARDNDTFLGIGKGPSLPHALLAALLKAMAHHVRA